MNKRTYECDRDIKKNQKKKKKKTTREKLYIKKK